MASDVRSMSFADAVRHLEAGDFSLLEPLFFRDDGGTPRIAEWLRAGLFEGAPAALAEALSCAAFLGAMPVVEAILDAGVSPAGGNGTGVNALHWAANRGQMEALQILIRRGAPLESLNMYGGTALGMAAWSAVHEPRPNHVAIVQALLDAGASLDTVETPTGHDEIDRVVAAHKARPRA